MANIEMDIESIRVNRASNQRVVLLKEREKEWYLPIWIEPTEVDAMVVSLQPFKIARPLTHDLICAIIKVFGGKINGVLIDEVRGTTFFAKLIVADKAGVMQFPCSPSDGMGLAIRAKAPIFVESSILDIFGIPGPGGTNPHSSEKQ